jgi:hypothetical protein
MAGMNRWLLCLAFVVAGIPFTGLVGSGIRFVFDEHQGDRFPGWYGWVFALAALIVSALYAGSAIAAATGVPSWTFLFRAALVATPLVALATLGSPPIVAGVLVLLLATWLLKRREPPRSLEPPTAPSDA